MNASERRISCSDVFARDRRRDEGEGRNGATTNLLATRIDIPSFKRKKGTPLLRCPSSSSSSSSPSSVVLIEEQWNQIIFPT